MAQTVLIQIAENVFGGYNVEEMTDMRRYWNKLYPQAPPADEAEIGPNCI